jgi:CubicO group peptidase (beta-lactamase class C family)
MRRASGQSVGRLLSERIWSKLGTEQAAYLLIDSDGTEFAGGGSNPVLRDMARFGEMMRLGGQFNGQQMVPVAGVNDIQFKGSREAFAQGGNCPGLPGWSCRNMGWVTHNALGAFAARGIHGQAIYIDRPAEMVIARLGSHRAGGQHPFRRHHAARLPRAGQVPDGPDPARGMAGVDPQHLLGFFDRRHVEVHRHGLAIAAAQHTLLHVGGARRLWRRAGW